MIDWRIGAQGIFVLLVSAAGGLLAAEDTGPEGRKGLMITIRGTIDTNLKNLVIGKSRAAAKQGAEVIIYDLQASHTIDFGPCYDLADAITRLGGTVQKTVAYVSQPITGHAVLVALACDEIVLSETGRLGDVYRDKPEGPTEIEKAAYQKIARDQGHGEWLALAMIDRPLELLEAVTPNGKRLLPAQQFEEFARNAKILNRDKPTAIKRPGELLFADAEQARRIGLSRRIVGSRQEVALAYGLSERAGSVDFLADEPTRAVVLTIEGAVDSRAYGYVLRRIRDIEEEKFNLVFVRIDSVHGDESAAGSIAAAIAGLRDRGVKTVAWVPKEASGPSLFIIFACNELVMGGKATISGYRKDGAGADDFRDFAASALEHAKGTTYPEALVRGFIDPAVSVFEARSKKDPRLRGLRTGDELENNQDWEKSRPGPIKEAGVVLTIDGSRAVELELAFGAADALDGLGQLYGVNDGLTILQASWVDELVDALTSSGGKFLLLTIGVMCLVLELHMPGFGIAGLASVICFVLFFWAHFLNNMANSLEIVLFLLGLGLLAMELFVLPGFGIAGVGGSLLLITSLVLASQASSVPEPASIMTVGAALIVVVAATIAFGRYLPQMPLLSRMVLSPDPGTDVESSDELESPDDADRLAPDLLGRRALAVSPLRPAGRIELDGRFYDVVSQGDFIEPGSHVEIVQVAPNRLVVREAPRA